MPNENVNQDLIADLIAEAIIKLEEGQAIQIEVAVNDLLNRQTPVILEPIVEKCVNARINDVLEQREAAFAKVLKPKRENSAEKQEFKEWFMFFYRNQNDFNVAEKLTLKMIDKLKSFGENDG